MKMFVIVMFYLLLSSICFSQDGPTKCQFDQSQLSSETVPNYLQPWWNNTRVGKFAVLFVDFPDGRYITEDDDTLQPFYDYQLEWVANNGELDAAGEMGLVLEQTNIPAGNKFVKASKYSWYNRWDMLFDSIGVYYGTAHPDWASNGDSAWGSFKQYWKEASNGKFELIPYTTHPNEQNYKLRTGIINGYEMIEGIPIIKCLKLPKKKYGTNSSNSYLRSYNSNEDLEAAAHAMIADATSLIISKTNFNLSQFYSEGGTLFIFFAGSHGGLKDIGTRTPKVTVLRSRENQITNPDSRIDGFGVAAHQYGHIEFDWYHTNSGRCDIMNGGDVHDNNSPQLPNPVFRIQQGWLNPTALQSSQQLDSLPPIETTYRCGVATIYGKPSAAPDWSSGEYMIVENRRRLGFDRTIVHNDILQDPQFRDFTGGLLVWHFSPYYNHPDPYGLGLGHVKFVHNDTMTFLAQNRGNPKTFFAWDVGASSQFFKLDSSKTYSAANLKTGIELKNIKNDNYGNINSTMSLRLNYLIAEPPQYSDVIFFRDYNKHSLNYSGAVFYHSFDTAGFFTLAPGSVIETAFNPSLSPFKFRTLEANGNESMPIAIKGAGYGDHVNYTMGITISLPVPFSTIDSLILSHIEFNNIQSSGAFTPIRIDNGSYLTPCVSAMTCIKGIMGSSIVLSNYPGSILKIADIVLNNIDLRFGFGQVVNYGRSEITDGNIHYNSCSPRFTGSSGLLRLHGNSEIVFESNDLGILIDSNASLNLNGASLYTVYPSHRWKGVSLYNSGYDSIINCTFSNAKTALSFINDEQHKFTNRIIKNCTFNIPTGGDYKGIYGENNYSILVEGNRFNMPVPPPVDAPFYTGVYLKNVTPSSPPEAAGEEGATATPYSLNIVNNTFRNGSSGIVLANYTSNLLPYYIKGNRFDSLDAHAATANIIGMKITGTIKDNVLSSSQSPIGIHLINSSPNLLNNIVNARDVALHLDVSSYANLAPNIYNNQAYWSGGRNTLSSYLYDNIQLAYMGNAYTDYGRNKFTVSSDSAYHIYGWLDTNVLRYHSRDNCWYTSEAAKIYLRHPGETMPVPSTTYNYGINCNSSPGPISWEVDNLGNGIFDSVLVSEDVSDSLPTEEEILIAQCEHYLNEMQMFGEAMISLKYYIDDYPEGEYTNDAIMNLYTAYLYLDTSANQNNRNILFGNLINYCEDKVASNLYDTQFEYLAGDVIAMCNFELENYDDAMNWYEFIALFYPDPDTRLTASWNYDEIEALIGSGTGGGEAELRIKNYELGMKSDHEKLELNRLFKAAQDDPVMRKLMRKFELQNRKMSEIDMQATNGSKQHEAESEMQNSKLSEADMLIYEKAKKNIFTAGTLQGKEAESDRMRDIVSMLPGARDLGKTVANNALPAEFALHQNYPNPFNPLTNIEYDLPVDGNIELKIYDIAGRLIKTLVNEFKTAGSYLVSFNASDLSSGVYFYSMNVDRKQIAVKRMALVK